MKIIAINGSPHGKRGSCSYLIKQMFTECEKLGAETEVIRLIKHKINFCLGCGKCMSEGICPQKDDVKEIQDKIREADGIVYASPVYVGHISGLLKNFIDRCFAMGHRPSLHDKYAAAVSAYAGIGDINMVTDYMLNNLSGQGAYPVGKVCAYTLNIKVSEEDQEKARQMGRDMVDAFRQKKKFDWEKQAMASKGFKALEKFITERKDLAKEDYKYWKEKGWTDK
ncbi:MAG: NAD(P)H-dependent oxidoreductase [Deltaproteobacteria bacterium]|nr:NAD(P)H-dependent oxidoreductase [Deltaproteobacteria bacterium]